MYHYVLIHGACMGAWSWYKLSDRLEKLGHKVTAMDMGASGGNPKEIQDIKTIEDYNYPLTEFMESLPSGEKVTLVGHSMGGLNISHAMNLFPDKISVAVFQSAFMPTSPMALSQSLKEAEEYIVDWLDTEFGYSESNEIKYFKFGKEFVGKRLCQNSSVEDAELVCKMMRKVPCFGGEVELNPETYGKVKRVYIVCKQDMVLGEEFQRMIIQRNPPHKVYELEESDHFASFSCPDEFASLLVEISSFSALEFTSHDIMISTDLKC